jgi:hypothetical protein
MNNEIDLQYYLFNNKILNILLINSFNLIWKYYVNISYCKWIFKLFENILIYEKIININNIYINNDISYIILYVSSFCGKDSIDVMINNYIKKILFNLTIYIINRYKVNKKKIICKQDTKFEEFEEYEIIK